MVKCDGMVVLGQIKNQQCIPLHTSISFLELVQPVVGYKL